MDAKIISIIAILALVAVAAFYAMSPLVNRSSENANSIPASTDTQAPPVSPSPSSVSADAAELSLVVGEEYSDMIQEELNRMSIEQPEFDNQVQSDIANDLSQFYY